MNNLVFMCVICLSISFGDVSGRSALTPETSVPEVKSNIIVLDIPTSGGADTKKIKLDGDRFYLEGKNFSSLDEMFKILDAEKKGRSSDSAPVEGMSTPEPYTLVVPVARNFSSLKELFEILKNDDNTVSIVPTNQTFVKGTEANSSDYTVFFAT